MRRPHGHVHPQTRGSADLLHWGARAQAALVAKVPAAAAQTAMGATNTWSPQRGIDRPEPARNPHYDNSFAISRLHNPPRTTVGDAPHHRRLPADEEQSLQPNYHQCAPPRPLLLDEAAHIKPIRRASSPHRSKRQVFLHLPRMGASAKPAQKRVSELTRHIKRQSRVTIPYDFSPVCLSGTRTVSGKMTIAETQAPWTHEPL